MTAPASDDAGVAVAAPAGSERIRDPERTRDRIVAAALEEFVAKGFAGARIDAIAERARVNKRMLYHYFGDKEELFAEILRRKIGARAPLVGAPPDRLDGWLEAIGAAHDDEWIRLLNWEGLETDPERPVAAADRRRWFKACVAALRAQQEAGRLDPELDPAQLYLSMLALDMFPCAFPQATRLATGLAPHDPRFRRARARFLQVLAARLMPATPD